MYKIDPVGLAPLKIFIFLIWLNLKVEPGQCGENQVQVSTNEGLEKILTTHDKYFRIQSLASSKFLTVEERDESPNPNRKKLLQNPEAFKKNSSLVPGITVDVDYEKRWNLNHLLDNQIWRVRQSLGFPFRNESFSPLYKFQSLSMLDHPSKLYETPFQLRSIGKKGNIQMFQIAKPFANDCATESQDELVFESCETDGNSKWLFLPATIPAKPTAETEDFDTYNTAEVS